MTRSEYHVRRGKWIALAFPFLFVAACFLSQPASGQAQFPQEYDTVEVDAGINATLNKTAILLLISCGLIATGVTTLLVDRIRQRRDRENQPGYGEDNTSVVGTRLP